MDDQEERKIPLFTVLKNGALHEVIYSVDKEEIQSLDSIRDSFFNDENSEQTAKGLILLASPVPEVNVSVSCGEGQSPSKDDPLDGTSFMSSSCWPFGTDTSNLHLTFENQKKQCDFVNQVFSARHLESVVQMSDSSIDLESKSNVEEENETYSEAEKSKEIIAPSPLRECLTEIPSSLLVEAIQGTEMQQLECVIHSPPDLCTSQLLPSMQVTSSEFERSAATAAEMPAETEFECILTNNDRAKDILATRAEDLITEYTSMLVEEAILVNKFQQVKPVELVTKDSLYEQDNLLAYSDTTFCCEQGQSKLVVQGMGNKSTNPTSLPAESVNSSLAERAIFAIATKEENWTPQSPIAVGGSTEMKIDESCLETKEKNSTSGSIWSRRDGDEEVFAPDKENLSPNMLQLRFLKNKGKLEEIKHSKSHGSRNSKDISSNNFLNESMSPSADKENQTPRVVQEQMLGRKPFGHHKKLDQGLDMMALENRVERTPFKSLLNSGSKNRTETSGGPASASESNNASNSYVGLPQSSNWDMVVDTASLLNKESRKALQLLQGLKGTRLIIPRIVIRELDIMKHRFSIFRRTSEASLVLEWIEKCMVETKWWIHVQSSMEEERLIAPTPRTSPKIEFSEEGWTFPCWTGSSEPLPSHKSLMEIVSPTGEDQILDYALLYKRKQSNGQLVLLSDNVTLKIKSMAESVQEFSESLVNPFSERFLWANSSPRGLTWSCQDDVVLREKYCSNPLRKSSKGEGARGLKLILLGNSQYGNIRSTGGSTL
ncbi:hypothetical protein L6164_007060 [Bauhinia variegata]|uniref:Uncharacterized protein n=1 Tax=Bauhinia variegata TaxID=167791 RepID=A0ACB9PWH0_BAUVA|nr:hypothetical protein L6164_007060 [Bauhinia variegata]